MKEECLICKAPLQYIDTDEVMGCSVCQKNTAAKQNVQMDILYVMNAIQAVLMRLFQYVLTANQKILLKYLKI